MDKKNIEDALKLVKFPGFSRDIVSFGLIREITVTQDVVQIGVEITSRDPRVPEQIAADIKVAIGKLEGVSEVKVCMEVNSPQQQATAKSGNASSPTNHTTMQQVKYTIAIASGKGGVGKSTITVNLACALQRLLEAENKTGVGIMDCDIYGPSVPLMLGVNGQPEIDNGLIRPISNFGVSSMSMGFLIDEDTPVVWRGPMIMKTIQQFAQNVNWGELEILVVDLPPGTGDAQLSLVQTIPLDGSIIITTPQAAAFQVARRGARMFEKVNVPIIGVIENMSYLEAADGSRQTIFGEGGGNETANSLKTQLLGQIPLEPSLRIGSDNGIPIVISDPDSNAAMAFTNIAKKVIKLLNTNCNK